MAYQNVSTIKPTHPLFKGGMKSPKISKKGGIFNKNVCVCVEGGGVDKKRRFVRTEGSLIFLLS